MGSLCSSSGLPRLFVWGALHSPRLRSVRTYANVFGLLIFLHCVPIFFLLLSLCPDFDETILKIHAYGMRLTVEDALSRNLEDVRACSAFHLNLFVF